jgi:Mg-chelatase subunit ChlD
MSFLRILILAFCFSIVTIGYCQEAPQLPEPTVRIGETTFVMQHLPTARPTNRVLFVFDKSGSMRGDRFAEALNLATFILRQAFDGWEASVLAFNDEQHRWPGIPEPDAARPIPPNWAAFPSEHAVQSMMEYISDLGAKGDTLVIPALRTALRENRDNLSIIIVSDGIFQKENSDDVMRAIAENQTWREEQGLGKALIMAVSVVNRPRPIMQRVAETSTLGHFRVQ